MVDVIFQQQVQLRQQRQALEESRRRLMSQQSLRQAQDRNIQLQRQQQLKQLGQAEQQISSQDLQLQQLQQQQNQEVQDRESVRQQALKTLVEKGKGSSALYSLPREERAAIEAYASELKRQKQKQAGMSAISLAESNLQASLIPSLRQDIYKTAAEGATTRVPPSILLPNISFRRQEQLFTPANQQLFTPAPSSLLVRQTPLVVAPAKTFTQRAKDIIFAPVERTRSGTYNLPAQVRKIAPLTSLTFSTGVAKIEQKLKDFGFGTDSPLFKETKIPVSKIVGDVALGSLLVGLSGTSQIGVSRYVKNGIVYEIDSAGNVISSTPVSQVNKEIIDFKQLLDESAVFKKAGSRYYNEPNLREKTRELINRANPKQLQSLRELYKKSGRSDLFNDILAQEKDIIVRTNKVSKVTSQAIKDTPSQLTGAGQVTSQFAGTGQYERTDAVAVTMPNQAQQVNQMLGLQQTGFQFEKLGIKQQARPIIISSAIPKTKQNTSQVNQLSLKTDKINKQGSGQARVLLNLFRTAQQTRQQSKQLTQQRSQLDFGKPRGRARPPRARVPFGFKLPSDSTSISKVGTEDSFGVGIEVRRGGRFTLLGKESSLGEALMKASRLVDVNLARSFRLRDVSTGELLDVKQLPTGFRRSKRESKTFVELSSRALSQFGEKKEIKYFKNVKGKRRLL